MLQFEEHLKSNASDQNRANQMKVPKVVGFSLKPLKDTHYHSFPILHSPRAIIHLFSKRGNMIPKLMCPSLHTRDISNIDEDAGVMLVSRR